MPRDLFNRRTADESPITASPDAQTPGCGSFGDQLQAPSGNPEDHVHPYVSTLSMKDFESCVTLEEETFPEAERVSTSSA